MNIQLYNDDCFNVFPHIPDKSVDMILCDLPYGTTKCKWDVILPLDKLWKEYNRIIKDHGAILLFGTQPFTSRLVLSNPKMFRYELIWEKDKPCNILQIHNQFGRVHENIEVFYKKQPVYNPQMEDRPGMSSDDDVGQNRIESWKNNEHLTHNQPKYKYSKTYDPSKRFPRGVIKITREHIKDKRRHPTQKPVKLLEYLIKTYTDENQTVLDNCMGGGSTGVACANTNRGFIGIEIDTQYFEYAKERIESSMGEKL